MEPEEVNLLLMTIIAIASLVLPWLGLKLVLGRSFLETAHVFVFWAVVWASGILGFHVQGAGFEGFGAGALIGAFFAIVFIILLGGGMLRPYSVENEVVVVEPESDNNDRAGKPDGRLKRFFAGFAPDPSPHVGRDAARAIEEQRAHHHNQGPFR